MNIISLHERYPYVAKVYKYCQDRRAWMEETGSNEQDYRDYIDYLDGEDDTYEIPPFWLKLGSVIDFLKGR
jgi:hypothetical protein